MKSTTQTGGVHVPETRLADDISTGAAYQYATIDMTHRALYCIALENGSGGSTLYTLHEGPSSDGPWLEIVTETSVAADETAFLKGSTHGSHLRLGVKQGSGSTTIAITANGK